MYTSVYIIKLFLFIPRSSASMNTKSIPDLMLCWMWFVCFCLFVSVSGLRYYWVETDGEMLHVSVFIIYFIEVVSYPFPFLSSLSLAVMLKVMCQVFVCVFDWLTCLFNSRAVSHKQRLTLACTLVSLWKRVWDEKKPCCSVHQRLWWSSVPWPFVQSWMTVYVSVQRFELNLCAKLEYHIKHMRIKHSFHPTSPREQNHQFLVNRGTKYH